MKKIFNLLIAAAVVMFAACSDDDTNVAPIPTPDPEPQPEAKTELMLDINMPISVENPRLKTLKVILTDVNNGSTTELNEFAEAGEGVYTLKSEVKAGTYNMAMNGVINYTRDNGTVESYVEAVREGIQVAEGKQTKVTIETTVSTLSSNDFVIEEIFFTGTLTPDGSQYYGDQYVKLTNNSDHTLYADGIVLMESEFLTVSKFDYTPDIMNEYFTICSTLIIPGSGKDYPVEPGKSIVIADTAIDHRTYNPKSLDLSKADFEYYNKLDDEDVDNPDVPNMISSTLGEDMRWTFHNRGFKSYAIGRLGDGVTPEQFATDYAYTAEYELVVPEHGTFPMSTDAWKFPNKWVIDAVNLSIEEMFAWIVTDPSLDSGWSYCGKIDRDQSRYGKSVIRQQVKLATGRTILKDTNNSTADFTPESVPSLM